jgi:hypothetical protein
MKIFCAKLGLPATGRLIVPAIVGGNISAAGF